jgi:PAS domain-containing protein
VLAAKDLARTTLECLLDPVVVWGKDGSVRLANEAAEEAFGPSSVCGARRSRHGAATRCTVEPP